MICIYQSSVLQLGASLELSKQKIWQDVLDEGSIAEAMRIALDDSSPPVITAAAESIYNLLGGENIQSAIGLQELLIPGKHPFGIVMI